MKAFHTVTSAIGRPTARNAALGAVAVLSIGLATASPASALTMWTFGATRASSTGTDPGAAAGQTVIVNFESPTVVSSPFISGPSTGAGYTEVDTGDVRIFNQSTGIAASPAGDSTQFESIEYGTATFTFTAPVNSLSVYLGSIDTYNSVTIGYGGTSKTFNGADLISANFGNQSSVVTNRRLFVNDAGGIQSITFGSTGVAFEYDDIAVGRLMAAPPAGAQPVVGVAVPEPATWALFLLGFGAVGWTLRGNRRQRDLVATA